MTRSELLHQLKLGNRLPAYLDFTGVDLSGLNLLGYNLWGAIMIDANLRDANLYCTNLRHANFRNANLSGARLMGAMLAGANLEGAHGLKYLAPIPETGEFIAWKKVSGGGILKLRIPADAKRTGSYTGRKCRASKVEVLEGEGYSIHSGNGLIHYIPGEVIEVCDTNLDPRIECAPGIHFFMTYEEAQRY